MHLNTCTCTFWITWKTFCIIFYHMFGFTLNETIYYDTFKIRWVYTRPLSALEVNFSSSVLGNHLKCTSVQVTVLGNHLKCTRVFLQDTAFTLKSNLTVLEGTNLALHRKTLPCIYLVKKSSIDRSRKQQQSSWTVPKWKDKNATDGFILLGKSK